MGSEVDEHGAGAVDGGEVDRRRAHASAAAQRLVRGEKWIGRLGSPQEPGGLLEAGVLGEAGSVDAAIVEASAFDQADGRIEHG